MSDIENGPRIDSNSGIGAVFHQEIDKKKTAEQEERDEQQRLLAEQEQAEYENRLLDWTGIKPGEPITDEQSHALEDLKDSMQQQEDSRKERDAVGGDYITEPSPFFKAQEKQAYKDAEEKLELELKSAGSGPEGIQKIKDLIKDFNRPIEGSKADTDYALTCYLIDRVVYGKYDIDYVPEKYGIQAAVDRALKPKTDQPQSSEPEPEPENEIPTNVESPVLETEEQPAVESEGVKTESPDPANSEDYKDEDDSQVLPPVLESEPATSPDKPEITYFDGPAAFMPGHIPDAGPETPGEEKPGSEVNVDESAFVPETPTPEVATETEPSTEPAPGSSNLGSGGVYDHKKDQGPYIPPEVSESTESNEDERTVEMPVSDEAAESTDNNDDPERGAPIDFKDPVTGKVEEGSKTTDSDYSEYSVGSAGQAIKEIPESETESDEDKIKLSFLERVKRAPHVLKDKIERLKSDGTFGEKVFWSGVGASAVILSGLVFQKYGIPIIHHGNEVTNAGSGASPDAVNAASTHVGDAVNVVSGSAEATGHANEALSHKETIKQGETIWGHVREALLRRDGKQPSNLQVLKDTLKTLNENDLTLRGARELANDTVVKIVLSAKK